MTDAVGKLVAEPLRRGCSYCRFHMRPFSHAPAEVSGPVVLLFLDLETTGTDVSSCRIVELAVAQAHDSDHLPAASFAQVVSVPAAILNSTSARAAAAIHGISDDEIGIGPAFPVVWERFLWFVEQVANNAVQEDDDSEDEDCCLRPPDEIVQIVLAAHNGYDPRGLVRASLCICCSFRFASHHQVQIRFPSLAVRIGA